MKVPGSGHVSCTVEMAALNTHADVAVIDEIQVQGIATGGFLDTVASSGCRCQVHTTASKWQVS